MSEATHLESTLDEQRTFAPNPAFSARAHIKSMEEYRAMAARAERDPDGYWAEHAKALLTWSKPWSKVLDWQPPVAKWFVGGELNVSVNCLDRHLESVRRDKPAILFEGEPGDRRVLTYAELHAEVCKWDPLESTCRHASLSIL